MENPGSVVTMMEDKILQGDCLQLMRDIPDGSVDLILTDPPYGINYQLQISAKNIFDPIKNDSCNDIDFEAFFKECHRVLKPHGCLYIFGRFDFLTRIFDDIKRSRLRYMHDFLWLKGDMSSGNLNTFGATHELMLCFSKESARKAEVLLVDGEAKKRTKASYYGKLSSKEYYGHPTQKPVGLCAYIIESRTKEGELVLDPFAGSGSTCVAAKLLNRHYIGMELDERYASLTCTRLQDETHLEMYRKRIGKGYISHNGSISIEKY